MTWMRLELVKSDVRCDSVGRAIEDGLEVTVLTGIADASRAISHADS